jgi:hypothetical protein
MDFVLRYRGPLHSNGKVKEKHEIRRILGKQLSELCSQEPLFQAALDPNIPKAILKSRKIEVKRPLESMFFFVELSGFQFVPLISRPHELACSVDIQMLRRERPGAIVTHGGDLDNRLKTLFDALRMPHNKSEMRGISPPTSTDRIFCLLEDDSLITRVAVNTYQLLEPLEKDEDETTVEILLQVQVQSTYPMRGNIGF